MSNRRPTPIIPAQQPPQKRPRTDDPRATSPSNPLQPSSKSRIPPKTISLQPYDSRSTRMGCITVKGARPLSVAPSPHSDRALPSPATSSPAIPTGPRHPSNKISTDAESTALVARFSHLLEPLQRRVRQLENERDSMARRMEVLEAQTKTVVERVFEAKIQEMEAHFVAQAPAAAPVSDGVTRAELDKLANKTRAELAKCATTEALSKMADKFKSTLDRYYVQEVKVDEIVKEIVRKEGVKALRTKVEACQETVGDLGTRVEQVEGSAGSSREAIGKVRAQVGQRLDLLEKAADDKPIKSEQDRQTTEQLATLSRRNSSTLSSLAALESIVDSLPTYESIGDVLKETVVAEVAEALSLLPRPVDLSKVESLMTSHLDVLSLPSRLQVLENDAQVAETHLRALPATIETVIREHQDEWIAPLVKDEVAVAMGGDKLVVALRPAFANKAQTNARLESALGRLATMRETLTRLETLTPRVPQLEHDVRYGALEIRSLKQSIVSLREERTKMSRVIAGVADALRTATPLLEAVVAPAPPVQFTTRDLVVKPFGE